MFSGRYSAILFDWGDTRTRDDPLQNGPMAAWTQVEAVPSVVELLSYLQKTGAYRLFVATDTAISTPDQVRAALLRVEIAHYFDKIYCTASVGLQKSSPAFYAYILEDLRLPAQQVLMVGDSFHNDVLVPNQVGLDAVWHNQHNLEERRAERHRTIHQMTRLVDWL